MACVHPHAGNPQAMQPRAQQGRRLHVLGEDAARRSDEGLDAEPLRPRAHRIPVERRDGFLQRGTTTAQAASDINTLLDDRVGSRAPDMAPVLKLLRAATDALARAQGQATDEQEGGDADNAGASDGRPTSGRAAGAIQSRADAVRELERVCDWLERHEPSNPAPLLIRRAQRLMNMSFIDIIRDMASNGLEQVELVAGRPPEES